MKDINYRKGFWLGVFLTFFGIVANLVLFIYVIPIPIIGSILILLSDKNIWVRILTIILLWAITPFIFMFSLFALSEGITK